MVMMMVVMMMMMMMVVVVAAIMLIMHLYIQSLPAVPRSNTEFHPCHQSSSSEH